MYNFRRNIIKKIDNILVKLPHDMRRNLWMKLFINEYKRKLLKFEHDSSYSIKPFYEKKCIFVHIPKAAGVSVSRSLFGCLGGGHRTLQDYQLIFNEKDFLSFYKFTIVRNPWDRIHSAYYFLKNGGMTGDDRCWARENIDTFSDFNDFILYWVNTKNIYKWIHFIPQVDFIKKCNREIGVDFIGKFENIHSDISVISKKIGFEAKLTHDNKTKMNKNYYYNEYNDQSIDIIKKVYSSDINMFNYKFYK